MKWIGISGTWKLTNDKVEDDVRSAVRKIIKAGDGIVTGGALNVDSFATEEALKYDPRAKQIKIFLPVTFGLYAKHYRKRATEGVITTKQAEDLIDLLTRVKNVNPNSIIENGKNKIVDKDSYFNRNTQIVEASDKIIIFHVVESTGGGTTDVDIKAANLGIPVERHDYKFSN